MSGRTIPRKGSSDDIFNKFDQIEQSSSVRTRRHSLMFSRICWARRSSKLFIESRAACLDTYFLQAFSEMPSSTSLIIRRRWLRTCLHENNFSFVLFNKLSSRRSSSTYPVPGPQIRTGNSESFFWHSVWASVRSSSMQRKLILDQIVIWAADLRSKSSLS